MDCVVKMQLIIAYPDIFFKTLILSDYVDPWAFLMLKALILYFFKAKMNQRSIFFKIIFVKLFNRGIPMKH